MYGLRFRDSLPPAVAEEFDNLVSWLKGWASLEHNDDGTHKIVIPDAVVQVGMVTGFAGSTAPDQWLICDGSLVSRVTYKSLYETIGTAYGAGDGSTTFAIPDLRQRFPLGKAASGTGAALGDTGGAIDHTHSGGSHTHTFSATSSTDGSHGHGGSTSTDGSHSHSGATGAQDLLVGIDYQIGGTADTFAGAHTHSISADGTHGHSITADGSHSHSVSGTTGSASGTTGTANPPYITLNYIIFTGVS